MYRFGFWLCSALALGSCSARPEPPPRAQPAPVAAPSAPPPPAARVTACAAQPSTVYGEEPVVFELAGEGSGEVEVYVLDQRKRTVYRGKSPVSGRVVVPELDSGDFSLHVGAPALSCEVTVNRELSRATSAAR